MKKRAFVIAILLLLSLSVSAQAAELRSIRIKPELYFSETTATCSVSIKADNANDKIEATLTLYQGNNYVDSWNNSGTGRVFVSGSCEVESGKSYKLVLDYSINGIAQLPKATTGTCP